MSDSKWVPPIQISQMSKANYIQIPCAKQMTHKPINFSFYFLKNSGEYFKQKMETKELGNGSSK